MIQTICLFILIIQPTLGFLVMVHKDINGKEAEEPRGFPGFCGSLTAYIIIMLVTYYAGLFNLFLSLIS